MSKRDNESPDVLGEDKSKYWFFKFMTYWAWMFDEEETEQEDILAAARGLVFAIRYLEAGKIKNYKDVKKEYKIPSGLVYDRFRTFAPFMDMAIIEHDKKAKGGSAKKSKTEETEEKDS